MAAVVQVGIDVLYLVSLLVEGVLLNHLYKYQLELLIQ